MKVFESDQTEVERRAINFGFMEKSESKRRRFVRLEEAIKIIKAFFLSRRKQKDRRRRTPNFLQYIWLEDVSTKIRSKIKEEPKHFQ
jgi:hypothetical protein